MSIGPKQLASYDELASVITDSLRGQEYTDRNALQRTIKSIIDNWIQQKQAVTGDSDNEWCEAHYGCGCSSYSTWKEGQMGNYGHETTYTSKCLLKSICQGYHSR